MSHDNTAPVIADCVLKLTGASRIVRQQSLHTLWGDYGNISRYHLAGAVYRSVIVKHIKLSVLPETQKDTPSHRRKRRSYAVEQYWYQHHQPLCPENTATARWIASVPLNNDDTLLILEDLQTRNFHPLRTVANSGAIQAGLIWLANLHARFLHYPASGLWPVGSYWHLDTRHEEWHGIGDPLLKAAAPWLNQKLRTARYQTLIHGDAKIENFCFNPRQSLAAAVDFQYSGAAPGIVDVVYFLDSCLSEIEYQHQQHHWLTLYGKALTSALKAQHPDVDSRTVIQEWLDLYPVAWLDFQRFLHGWDVRYATTVQPHTQQMQAWLLRQHPDLLT